MNTTLRTLAALAAIAAATAAIPATASEIDRMFYIGESGYDSWADAYAAASNGDTITVGANATMAISGGKTVTIDLAGGTLD